MVLKMDNTYSSAPQVGLGEADLVVEELVEGGMTRLAAFYYSQIPTEVGPVRSMRASDIGIVSPVRRRDGHLRRRAGDDRPDRGRRHPVLRRGRQGLLPRPTAPRRTTCSRTCPRPRRWRPGRAATPADYLPWGDDDGLPEGPAGATMAASFSGGHTTNWRFDGGEYVNENSYAGAGDEFPADTVLVLRVKVGDAGYLDPAGNPVPETKFTGKGQAMIFHDGRLVRGTWTKDAPRRADRAVDQGRRRSTVPAGHTWIELVPQDRRRRHLREVALRPRRERAGQSAAPESASDWKPARMKPIAASTRPRGLDRVVGGRDRLAGRGHRAEEDPGEGLQHLLVELPAAGAEHRAHDVEHGGERRALLLLAEPLVARAPPGPPG